VPGEEIRRGSRIVDLDRGGKGDRAGQGGVDMPGRERLAAWLCRGGGTWRCGYARVGKDFTGEKNIEEESSATWNTGVSYVPNTLLMWVQLSI
jgi:hypothetical protein